MERYLVGIDEAGRGPLAGPVAVGVVVVPKGFDWKVIPGVTDSKKLSEKKREEIFTIAQKLKREGVIEYRVALVGANVIDTVGITNAVARGIRRALTALALDPSACNIRLDGLLNAPPEFTHQKTIIKGDQKEKVIGLASILAKVTRDRHMVRLAKKHPKEYGAYGFQIHKGYGTSAHGEAIKKHGLSPVHRKTFCRKNRGHSAGSVLGGIESGNVGGGSFNRSVSCCKCPLSSMNGCDSSHSL